MNESNRYYNKHKRNRERQLFYQSTAWANARELALKRDNYLCVECLKEKKIRKADVVHHIIEVKDDFTKALELDNLSSICHMHHNKIHGQSKKEQTNISSKIDVVVSKQNKEMF
ncbi:hypothetical protein ABE61_04205 [Lysinibacillus sphaericus]|uniref:HNH endonuclease n=1 Tax=Lysinibacillus sphaericus TaxID=1421 RepID=UPI0018CD9152|nr:HNH endonuclease [Lysinibacillus sphaericus]MBG9453302.1 hypothetical protein [Lysinibacillus sphaericus]MBG9477094.1 hypothetical protein [Lysinibacillus sphaericus]MBG9591176.1 hypothetical protein [Lysinibacillus sphaericus]MBG9592006.1 hypothetical protein [Lysinibacillus sphaericus]